MTRLNRFKKSPLRKSENKEEKILLKKTLKKATMTVIMMFTKIVTTRKKNNLISAKKKKCYKKLDDYNYTFHEEKGAKLKLYQETKKFIAEIKGCW